jgi:hypothetical protein
MGLDPCSPAVKDIRMNRSINLVVLAVLCVSDARASWTATYQLENVEDLPGSVVKTLTWSAGPTETGDNGDSQWFFLHAIKGDGEEFRVWWLSRGYPPDSLTAAREATARYIVQVGSAQALEFFDRHTKDAVLPSLGGWKFLIPRAVKGAFGKATLPQRVAYLGHTYVLQEESALAPATTGRASMALPASRMIELRAGVLIGAASHRKQKDPTRRYDRSDYEMVPLTEEDYREMAEAGVNCFRVDAKQVDWIAEWNVFHWGVGGADVRYPECLYRSNYLGPALYFDEPGVVTRDSVVRPRLAKDPEQRKAVTPQLVLEDFRKHFHHELSDGPPARFLRGLAARPDVDLGSMAFLQQNLYTWETIVSTGSVQLAADEAGPPTAIVFEPPGRVGTRRTLPEINMTYGCQIPADSPKNFIEIIYGFLRGAARLTGKNWGMSIYGAVDRTDAFWFQTHAYDLGAKFFFYWDSYQLAAVPYPEYLALSRNLAAHVESHPDRDLAKLKTAAEVVILLPAGYNLGHVHLGKGSLWGLGELNLERRNREGVKYRVVMANFFTEIERLIRLGVAYDLLWDDPELTLAGYREVVRIREDGKVEVDDGSGGRVFDRARAPTRPAGDAPRLTVELSSTRGAAPLAVTARARVTDGSAAAYYTLGTNAQGIYRNTRVACEIYGPEAEDYYFLREEGLNSRLTETGASATVELDFVLQQPGTYRLRTATVDVVGRTTVVWTRVVVTK